MKIFLVTRGYPPQKGGVENYVGEIYERIKKNNDIKILVYSNPGHLGQHFIEIGHRGKNKVTRLANYYWSVFNNLIREEYDLIHANTEIVALGCILPSLIKRKPLVTTIHDVGFMKPNEQIGYFGVFLRKLIKKVVYYFSDAIITGGPRVKEQMVSHLGMRPEKIHTITYGVNTERFNTKISYGSLKIPYKEKVVFFVGMLYPKKGLDYAIEAMSKMRLNNVKLYIAGGEIVSGYKKSLEDKVRKLNLEERVVFLGSISNEQLSKWHRRADVFIHPGIGGGEGFSLTCLEANACGTPVVATPTFEETGVVKNGYNGIIVPSRDSDSIRIALEKILSDKKLHGKLSNNAIEFSSRFSWDGSAEKHVELFKKLI